MSLNARRTDRVKNLQRSYVFGNVMNAEQCGARVVSSEAGRNSSDKLCLDLPFRLEPPRKAFRDVPIKIGQPNSVNSPSRLSTSTS
jgi:hypothetical protein